jgi:hypothetical protein
VKAGLIKILKMLHPENDLKWTPKDSQTDVVNALIFGQSDVLFVARTGEGKSLMFQGWLTGLITIQIVPLNRAWKGAGMLSSIDMLSSINISSCP